MEKGYKKLIVWQVADELAYQIYVASRAFPKEEIYGITFQIRRAAVSIPTNISESSGCQNKGESKRFLNIALGSLSETEYLLEFCRRLNYLDETKFNELESLRQKVGALLWKFYRSYC